MNDVVEVFESYSKISLTFSHRRKRIRLTKGLLKELNYPKYIMLLINQSTLQVAIQPCNDDAKDAFNITEDSLNNKNGFELSCMTLIGKIYGMMNWSFNITYKCKDYFKVNNVLVFNLKNSTELLIVE